MKKKWVPLLALCAIALSFAWRPIHCLGEDDIDRSLLTLERIFTKEDFKDKTFPPARWLKDQSRYVALEPSKTFKDAKDVVTRDLETGERRVVALASRLVPSGHAKPLEIADYDWREDIGKLLIFTNTKRVWRQNTRGDYWIFDAESGDLQQLGGEAETSHMMFAKISPDGSRVAYVYKQNLYVQDLRRLRVKQLTKDGGENIINGTSDWVNEEELGIRDGYRWSPDGRFIAFWRFDTTGVKKFTMIDNSKALYPTLTTFHYPKVGQMNSAASVGVVSATGGRPRLLDIPGDPREHYIYHLEWRPHSSEVVVGQLNRPQNTCRLFLSDVDKGLLGGLRVAAPREILTETDEAWLDPDDKPVWLEEGEKFLWFTDQDGWRHIHAVVRSDDGRRWERRLLTPGDYDVIEVLRVDKENGYIYIIASPDNPTQRYLYRVPLEGGPAERVTPEDQPGTHGYQISNNAKWAIHTYSSFDRPPVTELTHLPDHVSSGTLEENSELREKLAELKPCETEFFRVKAAGIEMDAWSIKPPDFDPEKKYPLFIYVYGEPAGQTVLDKWGGEKYYWHTFLAQRGYVVVSIDNRGTPAPRGRKWRKSVYLQIGVQASIDQAAAVRKLLEERPYLDPERVGVWGWSGGGSMTLNAMFRYPELYKTGIAVAFISDELLYDTIYQERYMGLVDDNAEGYKNGSPITYAHQLEGNLLLVHGTGDDNCHFQSCERLINKLIEHNKQFSTMIYPNRGHSMRTGKNTKRHLYETFARFLKDNLPAD